MAEQLGCEGMVVSRQGAATDLLAGQAWESEKLVELALSDDEPARLVTAIAGSRRGDFTGAVGRLGAARRAVSERLPLLLDELQALDWNAQGALLSLLDDPRRLPGLCGPAERLPGPLHVIATTNHPVLDGHWANRFRSDLWHRFPAWSHVHLSPLTQRRPVVVEAARDHQIGDPSVGWITTSGMSNLLQSTSRRGTALAPGARTAVDSLGAVRTPARLWGIGESRFSLGFASASGA